MSRAQDRYARSDVGLTRNRIAQSPSATVGQFISTSALVDRLEIERTLLRGCPTLCLFVFFVLSLLVVLVVRADAAQHYDVPGAAFTV